MRVTDKLKKPCFEELKNPEILDFRNMVDSNSDDWLLVFEKQIYQRRAIYIIQGLSSTA